jgi:hypothetical protein
MASRIRSLWESFKFRPICGSDTAYEHSDFNAIQGQHSDRLVRLSTPVSTAADPVTLDVQSCPVSAPAAATAVAVQSAVLPESSDRLSF